jgi:hypothetical protein
MNQSDPFGRAYLRLTLEIEKHIPGYVDSYFGPAEIKVQVEAAEKKTPAALLDDLSWLQAHLPSEDANRRTYLQAFLRAMDCTLRQLNGEEISFLDEANRLYDIEPHLIEESCFTAAHRELDTVLPGDGSIAERLEARRKRYEIDHEKALALIDLACDETRRRTLALMELVEGESLEVTLVSNQPWSAYNWYKGNYHSLIEFNTDIPLSALALLGTFAHEGYPGHHTEGILKDKLLYREKGYVEESTRLLYSPAAVIAEGIATTALEIIFPNDSDDEWNVAVMLPAAGLPTEPVEQMRRISKAAQELRYVSGNAAILYHTGQLNEEQTVDYFRTYTLSSEPRARQSFRFINRYRAYPFTYTWGYDLIEQASNGGDKTPLFRRLLTEQLLPSDLQKLNTSMGGQQENDEQSR